MDIHIEHSCGYYSGEPKLPYGLKSSSISQKADAVFHFQNCWGSLPFKSFWAVCVWVGGGKKVILGLTQSNRTGAGTLNKIHGQTNRQEHYCE